MRYTPRQFRLMVVQPTLDAAATATGIPAIANRHSVALVMATAAIESGFGIVRAQRQLDGMPDYVRGPAFGICMLEVSSARTAQSVLTGIIQPSAPLSALWTDLTGVSVADALASDDRLARILMAVDEASVLLCRGFYHMISWPPNVEPLRIALWVHGFARVWARWYSRAHDPTLAGYAVDKIEKATDLLADVINPT